MKEFEEIKKEKEAWEKETRDGLKEPLGEKFTPTGIEAPLLATPADAHPDYLRDIGFPGKYPYTRGVYPTMHVGQPWTMRQYAGFASAEESNRRFKYLLEQGQTGLSVAFDLPTQTGYDSDNEDIGDEVGRVGVAVDTLGDMELLFDGIPMDKISTSFTINATAAIVLAMYIATGEKQGVGADKLRGTLQNDILKEYVARGTYIFPPEPSMRLTADIIEYCSKHATKFNAISICGYHMREAGCSAVNELAFTLGNTIAYVDKVMERGIPFDKFAPRLSFMFATHNDLFEEVAKYRAARRLWARLATEKYGSKDPRSALLRFHTQTGGSTLTREQPINNAVRIAVQCLATILGGAQSLHACSYDETFTIPTEETARLSLRTQQILAHESGLTNTVDPLGGSWYVEYLTDRIEEAAREKLEKISAEGGMVKLIEQGRIQREIMNQAYEYEKSVQSGERVIVGRNKYKIEEKQEVKLHESDPVFLEKQIERLNTARAERDTAKVTNTISALRDAAKGKDNLIPFVIDAVKAYATVGEITGALKDVFGEFKDDIKL